MRTVKREHRSWISNKTQDHCRLTLRVKAWQSALTHSIDPDASALPPDCVGAQTAAAKPRARRPATDSLTPADAQKKSHRCEAKRNSNALSSFRNWHRSFSPLDFIIYFQYLWRFLSFCVCDTNQELRSITTGTLRGQQNLKRQARETKFTSSGRRAIFYWYYMIWLCSVSSFSQKYRCCYLSPWDITQFVVVMTTESRRCVA